MLRKETVYALRSYTHLSENVQGILERHGDQFEFASGITRSDGFERALKSIDVDVFCVSKLRIMSNCTTVAGTIGGSFVLRGKAIKMERHILAIVAVVAGTVPDDLRSADNVYLVSVNDEDFLRCSVPQQLPFGVNVATDALVPKWNYLSSVFSKQVQHALVACPNGIFSFRNSALPSELSPAKAATLVKNLIDVDLVVEAESRAPKTIYRVAANCIFVGSDHAHQEVAALQRSLRIPGYLDAEKALSVSLPFYSIDASLLETAGPKVTYEAVCNSLPQGASLQRQPFIDWWTSPVSFTVTCKLTNATIEDTPVEMHMRFKEGPDRSFQVSFDVRAASFRELRPGETEAMLRNQLEAIFSSSTALTLVDFSATRVEQGTLDKLTRTLAEVLASNVNKAMLFKDAVTVSVKTAFDQTEGEMMRLPSGDAVMIPNYSFEVGSARLNAYLSIFSVLGMQGSFTSWDKAVKSRVLVA
jgi:hypothetical protein